MPYDKLSPNRARREGGIDKNKHEWRRIECVQHKKKDQCISIGRVHMYGSLNQANSSHGLITYMIKKTKVKRHQGHSPAPRAHHTKKKGAMNFWYFLTMSPFPFDCSGKRQKADREIECSCVSLHNHPFCLPSWTIGHFKHTKRCPPPPTIILFYTTPSAPAWRLAHRRWPSTQSRRWLPMSLFRHHHCQHQMPRWCTAEHRTKATRDAGRSQVKYFFGDYVL